MAMSRDLLALIFCFHNLAYTVVGCIVSQPAKPTPTNATDVHPGHISIVMAMGDSITAAFGADSLIQAQREDRRLHAEETPMEARQLAFSGGEGSAEHATLPYFLRKYNTSLTGFGTQSTLPQLPSTGYKYEEADALNVALSNSHSFELSKQVEELKKKTQNIPDFNARWKLLTLMIGANDLCDGYGTGFEACDGIPTNAKALVDRYEDYLRSTLNALRDSMQHIVIQLVSLFSISSVPKARSGHLWCNLRQRVLDECNCIDRTADGKSGSVSQQQLDRFDNTTEALNERIQKLTLEFNLQRSDFAVINAVAVKGQPLPGMSWLSELDCFHPSAVAHDGMAKVLWNSLFDKQRVPGLNPSAQLFCPTADDVIHVGEPAQQAAVVV